MATIIYNERVNTWRQMKQIDERLDSKPLKRDILEMVDLYIRNQQAFAELQAFNDTGSFLCVHPLMEGRSERARLQRLMRDDPQQFLRLHRNVSDNIRRYESYLKRADRQSRRAQDLQNLKRWRVQDQLFRSLIQQRE
ncbi:MAG: hypothetical protein Q4E49_04245 [Bacteroidales bacterium]|nr:hypothetical protein [Bacteroidales bacterium]